MNIDLWSHLLSFVDLDNVSVIMRTCKLFYKASRMERFWFQHALRKFRIFFGNNLLDKPLVIFVQTSKTKTFRLQVQWMFLQILQISKTGTGLSMISLSSKQSKITTIKYIFGVRYNTRNEHECVYITITNQNNGYWQIVGNNGKIQLLSYEFNIKSGCYFNFVKITLETGLNPYFCDFCNISNVSWKTSNGDIIKATHAEPVLLPSTNKITVTNILGQTEEKSISSSSFIDYLLK
jgi:hypothetical protein